MANKSNVILSALCIFITLTFVFIDPIPQPEKYNIFADSREFITIRNFFDVISSIPFILIGAVGIILEIKKKLSQDNMPEVPIYRILFFGVFLTGAGSIYYHLSPNNDTLVWDRLPMTIVFVSLFVGLMSEHIGKEWQRWLFYPLLLAGFASVFYWHFTEQAGRGDLRPYLLVQFLPLLMVPLVMLMYRSRFNGRIHIWWMLGCYLLAKLSELYDLEIYQWSGLVSGHTLKHILVAIALLILLRMLFCRQQIA
ncbi:ceramidase domain-containing protein [Porticoccus sp.]